MADVLLDTTFLLPTLGFEVREIETNDLRSLMSASKSGTRLFCSYVSFIEIFGKLARNLSKITFAQSSVEEGIRSLLESNTYEWVNPTTEALTKAFSLRLKGHKDNIDNILYSIASTSNMFFLSLDLELRKFLAKNGFDEKIVITPGRLASMVNV
ncbi:MAG: hypothetical protein OK439_03530 [Thaumarchaeota archaeon]|nr:hypothetical protein [Nitrososphaerota archaeon]